MVIFSGKIAVMIAVLLRAGRQKVKEKGKTENHLETYSRERKARGRLEVMGGGTDRSNQSRGVEKLCEGPMCHEAQRG